MKKWPLPLYMVMVILNACSRSPEIATNPPPPGVKFAAPFSWVYQAASPEERDILDFILKFECALSGSQSKSVFAGTGFLLRGGFAVTNYHVAQACAGAQIVARSATGREITFLEGKGDPNLDLAIFVTANTTEGLEVGNEESLRNGEELYSWGFLADYPSPLRTTGTLAGFSVIESHGVHVKSLAINGAINKGNSGAPILVRGSRKIVGIAVSKYAPVPLVVGQALNALSANKSGFMYNYNDGTSKKTKLVSEAQVQALVHNFLLQQVQLVIGNAIAASVLNDYLTATARQFSMACTKTSGASQINQMAARSPSKTGVGTR